MGRISLKKYLLCSMILALISSGLHWFPDIPARILAAETDNLSAEELNTIGLSHFNRKDYTTARRYFTLAVARCPDRKHYLNNLSAACMGEDDLHGAKKYLEGALALDPNYCKALSNMAIVYFRLFRFPEAYRYYQKAKKADPRYAATRFAKRRVIEKVESMNKKSPGNQDLEAILNYLKASDKPFEAQEIPLN